VLFPGILKLGGVDKYLEEGGAYREKAQIYIENIKKNEKIALSWKCGGV